MKRIDIPGISQGCSKLVMGSMMLAEDRMDFVNELLDTYVSFGGNTIDTAHVYGASSNIAVGLWMKARGNRSDIVIIGKGAHPDQHGPRVNREAIAHDLEVTLERIQTDYVDIYMLHRDDPNQSVGSILESLQEHLESGRCRAIGVSNWTYERIEEANDYAAQNGLTGFTCNSPNLSLAKPNEPRWPGCISIDDNYAAWHESTQMPLLSWSSQAGGFFTNRFAPDNFDDPEAVRVYYSEANWERRRRAEELGREKGVSAHQIALAYVLHQPFPNCALIGPSHVRELEESTEALQVDLTPEQLRWLELKDS